MTAPSDRMRQVPRRLRVARGFEQTAESLAIYRIIFGVWSLFLIGTSPLGIGQTSGAVGELPGGFFHPPLGPFMVFGGWPPESTMLALEVIRTVAIGMILVGARVRFASLITAVTGFALSGLLFGDGKIDHTILWVVILPAVMAFTSWGDTWSFDARRAATLDKASFASPAVRPVQIIAVCLGVMFGAAALVKAATGWLDPSASSTLGWVFGEQIQRGVPVEGAWFLNALPSGAWLAADYATVLFEAGFVIAALRRKWLVPYLLLGAVFHFSAGLTGFPNFFDIGIVYLLFVRFDVLAEWLRGPLDIAQRFIDQRRLMAGTVVAAILAAYCARAFQAGSPTTVVQFLDSHGAPLRLLWPAVILFWVIRVATRKQVSEDRHGDKTPRSFMAIGLVVLAAQFAVTLVVSEPYPSLSGPHFAGTFHHDDQVDVVQQRFEVVADGQSSPVTRADVIGVDGAFAVRVASVRFPAPVLDHDDNAIDHPSLIQRLGSQYHQFSTRHLPNYGGGLDSEERAFIKANVVAAGATCDRSCELRVSWDRLTFDSHTGDRLDTQQVSSMAYPLD